MQLYFLDHKNNDEFVIDETHHYFHHLMRVMRCKKGDLNICVHKNIKYLTKIVLIKKVIILKIVKKLTSFVNKYEIILYFPLLKNQIDKYIIQKATELGVTSLAPLIFTNSAVINADYANKEQRFLKIIETSCRQSHNLIFPNLLHVTKLQKTQFPSDAIKILAYEKANQKNTFLNLSQALSFHTTNKFVILIGPEGGLTKDEVELLEAKNFLTVSLGNAILRSDTAAIYLLSVVKNFLNF